jgi:ADP-heptose:LPS heptosyltransferase
MKLVDMNIQTNIEPGEYVGIYMQGLFGDTVYASCYFDHILRKYPNAKWIVVHAYMNAQRLELVFDLLRYHIEQGRIAHYFFYQAPCVPMPQRAIDIFAQANVRETFDLLAYHAPHELRTVPNLGIPLDYPKDPKKAVICRYSGWHGHFIGRNRPKEEWDIIEAKLLEAGYDVYLTGYDDPYPIGPGIRDALYMPVFETLDFAKDASLVITPLTFLYVFTQFTCKTLVISPPDHTAGQFDTWKITDKLVPINVDGTHIQAILNEITPVLH